MSQQRSQQQPSRAPQLAGSMLLTATTAATLGIGSTAAASGFALTERDAAGLGRAFAGQVAVTSAASLSVNPAALPQAPTLNASLSAFANQLEATDASGERADGGVNALVPAAHGAWKGAGIGLDVPFGLSTRYPDDWSGRTAALESAITAARLTLGGGLEVAPGLRLGAAIFGQYLKADLSNTVLLAPGLEDRVQVDGSDIGLGVGLGALWQPREDLTLGLGYTSPVWHELTGDADLPALLGSRADANVKIATPESIRLGLDWQTADQWRLLAGVEWTRWSRLSRSTSASRTD